MRVCWMLLYKKQASLLLFNILIKYTGIFEESPEKNLGLGKEATSFPSQILYKQSSSRTDYVFGEEGGTTHRQMG